jgi:KipI family sensor histidine kinase inhibitor
MPGGDTFVLVQFGDEALIDLNFMALGLTAALREDATKGVVDTNPSYNSLVVEYEPDLISLGDLETELRRLIDGLGSVEDLELNSRLAYLPVMYLDPWTKECVEDYSERITPREYDPDYVAKLNGLEDANQLVRVHSGTEHWVVAVCSTPGLPLMVGLDPRCAITSPKYNPPRTWTTLGAIGVGGLSTSIYTTPGPGGYNLIGRTPVPLWDTKQSLPAYQERVVLLDAADRVKFVPVEREEFDYVERRVEEGTYDFNITAYQRFSVRDYKAWAASLDKTVRF